MSTQEILDIARRHQTRIADAMVAGCVAHAIDSGEDLETTREDIRRFIDVTQGPDRVLFC